jgi:hypothetical protein
MTTHSDSPERPQPSSFRPGLRSLKTGFLIAGSAFLGGLTVVLWNRKSLAKLRQSHLEGNHPSSPQDVETE